MNPSILVTLLIDQSTSLREMIREVLKAIRKLVVNLRTHPDLSGYDVFLSVIVYSSSHRYVINTVNVNDIDLSVIDSITSEGSTNPGPAILEALNDNINTYYKWKLTDGIECSHGLIFNFTDGKPDAGVNSTKEQQEAVDEAYRAACEAVREAENNQKIVFSSCAFGANADIDKLKALTNFPNRVVDCTDGSVDKLNEFFAEIIVRTTIFVTHGEDLIDDVFRSRAT